MNSSSIERNQVRLSTPNSSTGHTQTTDGSTVALTSSKPKNDGMHSFEFWAQALLSDGSAGAWIRQRGGYRVLAGVVTVLATPVKEGVAEAGTSLTTSSLTVTTDGTSVFYNVVGQAGKTLNWRGIVETWRGI